MTDGGFTTLRDWMTTRLGLIGTPLVLYARIYQKFDRFGEKTSAYSLKEYGAGNTQIVTKGLRFLVDNGFIEEIEEVNSKGFKNKVYAPVMKKLDEYSVPQKLRSYKQ